MMRVLLVVAVVVSLGCGGSKDLSCAGSCAPIEDAGPQPVCDPPAVKDERCLFLAEVIVCEQTEAAQRLRYEAWCPNYLDVNARPLRAECGAITGWVEPRGRDSTITNADCWYLDGGLIGLKASTDIGTFVAGTRPTSGCTFDAGCAP